MINPKELLAEIDQLSNMKTLVQAYEEIAASYMRRIRNSVIQKREFLSGINVIFAQVKQSYTAEIEELLKQKKKKAGKEDGKKRNGKTILVLLSANTGLYGDIVKRTYSLFIDEVKKSQQTQEQTDTAIVGRLGALLFKEENLPVKSQIFDFPDNAIDPSNLRTIVEFLVQYEKVIVFYGQFQSVITQIPTKSSVSGDQPTTQEKDTPIIKYLFEPSLKNILNFFENEIIASIFEQTIHESQLSKFASRMLTLDSANENIKTTLRKAELSHQRIKHSIQNKKQLSALSGMSLWKR